MPVLKSASAHVRWPALPGTAGERLLAVLFQFEQSQWWDADQLRSAQRPQLRALLTHALRTVPYLADRFAGIDADAMLANWSDLPILTRKELHLAGSRLNSTRVPPEFGRAVTAQTSGSTGQPVAIQWSNVNQMLWMAYTVREHLWHRRDVTGTLALIRPDRGLDVGASRDNPDWGPPMNLLFATGRSSILDGRTDVDTQVQWLRERQPTYLLSLPSNLKALAEVTLARGLELQNLRGVRSYGEVMTSEIRALCEAAWGAPVTDVYSAQEIGYLAFQCPEQPCYHLQSEHVIIEILDAGGRPCEPGQVGRIVLTPLHHFATPLIRYEIGDYAEVGEPCGCGRGLPVINRIIGRERNLMVLKDGRRFRPSFPADAWAHLDAIENIQLIQQSVEDIKVNYVGQRGLTAAEQAELAKILRSTLHHDFRFSFQQLGQLPRHPSGKYEDFICEVTPPEHETV